MALHLTPQPASTAARGGNVTPSAAAPAAPRDWRAHGAAQIAAGVSTLLLVSLWLFGTDPFGPLRHPLQATWPAALLIGALGLGMTAWDLLFMRSWRHNLDGVHPGRHQGRRARVLRKWLGLQVVLALLALVYTVLKVYRAELYQPFLTVALTLWPWFALGSVPYIAWVDARMAQPLDVYWRIGQRLLGGRCDWPAKAEWRSFVLGWVVKGFFLPLMFGYATRQLVSLWGHLHAPASQAHGTVEQFRLVFEAVFTGCYFVDVIWGATGYLWSLRLTDSHVRSAEPTAGGWIAALACYEPFSKGLWPAYFAYGSERAWGYWMGDMPLAYVLWGSAILLLLMVYTASTMAFGLKFSNLTHRGIVTHGPYRWSRHPAYLSKNLSWWMISLPFLAGDTALESLRLCAMLLAVNALYFWRAHTESRHLLADPAYAAYSTAVAQRQARLWAGAGRALRAWRRSVRIESVRDPALQPDLTPGPDALAAAGEGPSSTGLTAPKTFQAPAALHAAAPGRHP